ncbi:hypothetical protein GDO81_029157 [Engystomops pustulosus]|uniref:Lanosterol 14-alpha demethylase n=1 Tax=Engystomops pustulosus TaxID=76066 RepID=A0AAV6ZFR6_ENGPU|nr:hypothetical protein GDO81_029157 [Engystomops pustulosus]
MLVSLWQAGGALLEEAVGGSLASKVLLPCAFLLTIAYLSKLAFKHLNTVEADNVKYPPYIPSVIPFLGHAISFGKSPIEFLERAYEKYGPVFSFTMVGKTFTYLVGSDAAALLFNSKNEDLNAEDVYSRLTTPVFGKGVAYDVPNPIFLEQKKMFKTGLNIAHFKTHVRMIEEETVDYFKRWGDSGVGSKKRSWKSFIKIVYGAHNSQSELHGTPLNDDEIAGMLIGLLLAGQHTSSTTSAWMGFFMAKHKSVQDQCFAEQKAVCGEDFPPLHYDQLKDLQVLDRCIKETLRLRPPIMTMMRMARTPQSVAGYNIPPGHQVCVSPTVNHRLHDTWVQNTEFNPDRYLHENPAAGEKFAYVPFGAGRHRCIGENFAYVQIKTIWSTMLRLYEFDLVDGYFPTINYTTMIHTPNNPIIRYKRRKL